jgi:hypothetical protein
MNAYEIDELQKVLSPYRTKWSPDQIESWTKACSFVSGVEILESAKWWVRTHEKPPTPANLLNHIREMERAQHTTRTVIEGQKTYRCPLCLDFGFLEQETIAPEDHCFAGAEYTVMMPCSCEFGRSRVLPSSRSPVPIGGGEPKPRNDVSWMVEAIRGDIEEWSKLPATAGPCARKTIACSYSRQCPERVQIMRAIAPRYTCPYRVGWDAWMVTSGNL